MLPDCIDKKEIIFPPALKPGDKIALLSPASAVKEEYVRGAMDKIILEGYEPVLMPHALGHECGSYASASGSRLLDLMEALEDKEIRAILCTRGGYGCASLLMNLHESLIARDPKWIIGFSDVSALLAKWYNAGIASIHGPMAKHLATESLDNPCTRALFNILEQGGKFDYMFPSFHGNRPGTVKGTLRGGNLAVLNDLAASPYDLLKIGHGEDVILFFEDISEPIYAIERMLLRLALSGSLARVKGLIFGQFTEYRPDKNFNTAEDMINTGLDCWLIRDIPVALQFPVGHIRENYPLVEGAEVEFTVTDTQVRLRTLH